MYSSFMKQITDDQTQVTKAILQETLKIEFKKELENYPTKTDLNKALNNYPTKVDMKIEMDQLEMRMDDKARIYRDQILTKMDQIIGELAQMREERAFDRFDKKTLEKKVANHEERITKLENKKSPSHH